MKFEAIRGARILVDACPTLKPGRQFLVVSDTKESGVAELIAAGVMRPPISSLLK